MKFRCAPMAAFLAVALLSACSGGSEQATPRPRQRLVGLSRSALVACAGQPQGTTQAGDVEYILYRAEKTLGSGNFTSIPRIPVIGSISTGGSGTQVTCEATFVVKNGTIAAVALRADPVQDAKTTADICAPITRSCPPS